MSFSKTNLNDGILPLSGWCACPNCGYQNGDVPPSSEYNKRSGRYNPKQNS